MTRGAITRLSDLMVIPQEAFDAMEEKLMDGLKCIRVVRTWLDNAGPRKFKAEITQLDGAYNLVKHALDLMDRP